MKITIDTIDLAYADHGIGQPVIFLHAFPLNRMMWEGQIAALLREQRYRLVAPDWRGFGESGIVEGTPSTMDLFARDIAGLMDALGMRQAVLCGLSMGGYAAMAFYRQHPERVSGLILADTRPNADNEEGRANREQLAQVAEREGPDAVADRQLPRLLAAETRKHHPEVEARVRSMIATATPYGIAAASRGMAQRQDSTALLAHITCPTLVIVGAEDGLTPPAVAHAYAGQIPGAQLAQIAHAGHLSNLEQPEAFYTVVSNFLQAHF
ncbi:alpha/beta hydrolase [Ktedonobacteria bacterium brp13]|nr:alpha/beta hydrolase [Ktedonobacteria bacterium brp13]